MEILVNTAVSKVKLIFPRVHKTADFYGKTDLL